MDQILVFLIKAAQLILSLTILVFIHELGHFLAAKAFGIKVEKFYIFFDAFGKKLFSFTKGGTEYGGGWLPLGGYVKIAGMIDESMDKEQLAKEPEEWEFRSKPVWQRFIVMIAGVVMNIILGVVLFAFYLFHYEQEYVPINALEDGIYAHETAIEGGLRTGDRIISIDGKEPERFDDLKSMKILFGADLVVEREGEKVEVKLPGNLFRKIAKAPFISTKHESVFVGGMPVDGNAENSGLKVGDQIISVNDHEVENFASMSDLLNEYKNAKVNLKLKRDSKFISISTKIDSFGRIGFNPKITYKDNYKTEPYTISSAFKYGFREAFSTVIVNTIGLSKIFTGEINARDSVQSPIAIGNLFSATWDWKLFWKLTALISMVLAFMNILPIPALDGGHIMFLIIEAVQGKPVSEAIMEKAQIFGMILLLAIMVFAFGNDILKLFGL